MRRTSATLLFHATLWWSACPAAGEVLSLTNGALEPEGPASSLAEATLDGWERQGKASDVRAFPRGAAGFAVALTGGARLAQEIALPPLEEGQDPAGFQILVSVDVLGVFEEGKRGAWTLEVRHRQKTVGVARGTTERLAIALGDLVAERAWAVVPGEVLAGLAAEAAPTLGVRVSGRRGVVLDEVRAYRVPLLPTRAMLAKPNGVDGPDQLDCGALGFQAFTAHGHAPLPIMLIRPGSGAGTAGLVAGDVLIAVDGVPLPISSCQPGWDWFHRGHEAVLGRAVAAARRRAGRGSGSGDPLVELTVLRDGETRRFEVPVHGHPLGDDFPFDAAPDGATDALYTDLIAYIVASQRPEGCWATGGNDAIQTCFAGLALLGTRDPAHGPRIRDAAQWMLKKFAHPEDFGNLGFWFSGYAGIFISEYHLATGDPSVLPWLERALQWSVDYPHTSRWKVPALGHGPDGLPYEQKALVAPAVHVLLFEALAVRCGVKSRVWEMLLPFMELAWSDPSQTYGDKPGHGALGYNASYRDLGEFWSRSGLFSLTCHLRGDRPDMATAMAKVMVARFPWMRNSHAYGAPGDVWGLIGLSQVDPAGFQDVMTAWRPFLEGSWEPGFGLRFTMPHMGAPYMGEEGLINPTFAALLSVRTKGLHITGATDRGWLQVDPLVDGGTSPGIDRNGQVDDPSSSFTIVEASGDADPGRAKARAEHLIDGDSRMPWIPDRGQDAAGYPHHVVIDLGRRLPVVAIELDNGNGRRGAARVDVAVSDEVGTSEPQAEASIEPGGSHRIDLRKPVIGRYVRVRFLEGHGEAMELRDLRVVSPRW